MHSNMKTDDYEIRYRSISRRVILFNRHLKQMKRYKLDVQIVYEDEYLVAVNKPSGVLSVQGKSKYIEDYMPRHEQWKHSVEQLYHHTPAKLSIAAKQIVVHLIKDHLIPPRKKGRLLEMIDKIVTKHKLTPINYEEEIWNKLVTYDFELHKNSSIVRKQEGNKEGGAIQQVEISICEVLEQQYQSRLFHVHRLDQETSGLLLFAKTDDVASIIGTQFQTRTIKKIYQAIVYGRIPQGTNKIEYKIRPDLNHRPMQIVDPIDGKESRTNITHIHYTQYNNLHVSHPPLSSESSYIHMTRTVTRLIGSYNDNDNGSGGRSSSSRSSRMNNNNSGDINTPADISDTLRQDCIHTTITCNMHHGNTDENNSSNKNEACQQVTTIRDSDETKTDRLHSISLHDSEPTVITTIATTTSESNTASVRISENNDTQIQPSIVSPLEAATTTSESNTASVRISENNDTQIQPSIVSPLEAATTTSESNTASVSISENNDTQIQPSIVSPLETATSCSSRSSSRVSSSVENIGTCTSHECTLVTLEPITGRTHQLRVHLSTLGYPILGDTLYAPPYIMQLSTRLLLHAYSISFIHPYTKEWMTLTCPCPDFHPYIPSSSSSTTTNTTTSNTLL